MRTFYKQKLISGHIEVIHIYKTGRDSFLFLRGTPGELSKIRSFVIESDLYRNANQKLLKLIDLLEKNDCERINYEDLDKVFLKILYPEGEEEIKDDIFSRTLEVRNKFMDKFEGEISQRLLGFNYASDMGGEGASVLYSCFDIDKFTDFSKTSLTKETDINNFVIAVKKVGEDEWRVVFPENYNKEFNIL